MTRDLLGSTINGSGKNLVWKYELIRFPADDHERKDAMGQPEVYSARGI